MTNYNFFLISAIVLSSYLVSFFLVKFEKITQIQHRRFWNLILLITFLVSCLLGLFLAFSIDQQISLKFYLPFIWYHVEFGIIMSLVAVFHTLWHLPYFASFFSRRK